MGKKTAPKATDLEGVLRKAIRDSGLTRYAVAKGADVDTSQLLRFVAGKRSLTLPAASKLAAFLGLELRPVERGKGPHYRPAVERGRAGRCSDTRQTAGGSFRTSAQKGG